MKNADAVFSALLALFCGIYLFLSSRIKFGTLSETGPGFIPVLLGTAGLVIALVIMINSFRSAANKKAEAMPREGKLRFLYCVVICFAFVPLFELLGAIIALFALILALTKIWGTDGWFRPFALATSSAAIAYVVFGNVLEVPLPPGILEFFI